MRPRRRCCAASVLLLPLLLLAYVALFDRRDETLYDRLGLTASATASQIKAAYRKLALKLHPDKVRDPREKPASEAMFKRIAEAHETLSNADRRAHYDANLKGSNVPDPMPAQEAESTLPPDVKPPLTWAEEIAARGHEWVHARYTSADGGPRYDALAADGTALLVICAARLAAVRVLWWRRRRRAEHAAKELMAAEGSAGSSVTAAVSSTSRSATQRSRAAGGVTSTQMVRYCRFCDVRVDLEHGEAHLSGKKHLKVGRHVGRQADRHVGR